MPQGRRVRTLDDLKDAIDERRAVHCPGRHGLLRKPRPAAVVINFTGGIIWNLMTSGMYIYEKPLTEKKDESTE